MEKLFKINIYFDFYGKLLTPKQYQIIELYYLNDYSLSEVAEYLEITRQAVFDTLKRAEEKLFNYEKQLGLVDKFQPSQIAIKNIRRLALEINKIGININNKDIIIKSQEIEETISKVII
ncbi:MAG: sigma factor-like helix-turn-helix DNA-binding protein [Gudongella sp.]|jgi:predicted DNA-binding protein YlxM (UPF0122 family)|nr:sigma factor-like helix-turn-helix DNA-binding protein [Gudongella sp.]